MSSDGHRIKCRRNIAENLNRLSRVHERYRQTTNSIRQTDGQRHIANMNVSSRSLKTGKKLALKKNDARYAVVPSCLHTV